MHSAALAADPLAVGIAVVDITPPIPYRMSGYFEERLSTGTKDPLHAKAIVFRQGDESAALCVLRSRWPARCRHRSKHESRPRDATGIPADHIAVAATHTHTGPMYFDALRNHFHERSVERLGSDPYEKFDYPTELVAKIVAAVVEANAKLQPVELESGYADETRLSFNRRFHMKDGTVRFNPGELNPDIIRPAGPIDPQVGIITFTPPGTAKPAAAIVSFALHLDTISGTEYSADYPKHCEDRLREAFGPDFTLLFGAGTCGDINHIDVTTRRPTQGAGNRQHARRIGRCRRIADSNWRPADDAYACRADSKDRRAIAIVLAERDRRSQEEHGSHRHARAAVSRASESVQNRQPRTQEGSDAAARSAGISPERRHRDRHAAGRNLRRVWAWPSKRRRRSRRRSSSSSPTIRSATSPQKGHSPKAATKPSTPRSMPGGGEKLVDTAIAPA